MLLKGKIFLGSSGIPANSKEGVLPRSRPPPEERVALPADASRPGHAGVGRPPLPGAAEDPPRREEGRRRHRGRVSLAPPAYP